jgi:hypothetical protein
MITDKILVSLVPKQYRLITPALQFHTACWPNRAALILATDSARNEDCFVIRFEVRNVSVRKQSVLLK